MSNGSDTQDTLNKTWKRKDMYPWTSLLAVTLLGLGSQEALAQARWILQSVALKSGESVEVGDLYFTSSGTCRSLLKDLPVVEVMEGPSEVTASVKEAMVIPRAQGCSQKIKGGRLVLTAKDIKGIQHEQANRQDHLSYEGRRHPAQQVTQCYAFPQAGIAPKQRQETAMGFKGVILGVPLLLHVLAASAPALAQDGTLKAKSGDTINLLPVFRQVNCRGTLMATPEVEVFQAPPELKLTIRDELVEVTGANCPAKVKGAMVVVTVGQIVQPAQGRMVFRVKYKGKYRESQTGHAYDFTLSLKFAAFRLACSWAVFASIHPAGLGVLALPSMRQRSSTVLRGCEGRSPKRSRSNKHNACFWIATAAKSRLAMTASVPELSGLLWPLLSAAFFALTNGIVSVGSYYS